MFYCFLADGFEEIEALTTIDILRRADIDVKTVGVTGEMVNGAHGIEVKSDLSINEISMDASLDGVILPGGMPGVTNLEKNENVKEAIRFAFDNDRYLCAICAAPSILGKMGLLNGKKATCYPGFEKVLEGCEPQPNPIVTDGKIITSKGAGTAFLFGLTIVMNVISKEKSFDLATSMQFL